MLALDDRLCLAPCVTLAANGVADEVQDRMWPVNATARLVLASAETGETLNQVVERVVAAHGVLRETAERDVLVFAWALNRRYLANVRPAKGYLRRRLRLALRLLPAGVLPPGRVVRRPVCPGGGLARALSMVRALGPRASLVTGVAALPLVQGLSDPAVAIGVASSAGAGIVLHELGHALALGRRPAAVVLAGLRVLVLHAKLLPAVRRRVAVAGPGLVVGTGLVAAVCAETTGSLALALCSATWLGHAVGLTVLTNDGRNACLS
ncbi:MAG: PqqD family protein [Gaiella sp.]